MATASQYRAPVSRMSSRFIQRVEEKTTASGSLEPAEIKKSKLVLLIETEPTADEYKCLYRMTDDILLVNDYNQSRTIAQLLATCSVLIVDLIKYLRFYEQSYKTIPESALVIKYCVRGLAIDLSVKQDLHADAVVKYLPTEPKGQLQDYVNNLADHIPRSVVFTSSLLKQVKVKLMFQK